MPLPDSMIQFLASVHPYDSLSHDEVTELSARCETRNFGSSGSTVFVPANSQAKALETAKELRQLTGYPTLTTRTLR